MIEGRGKLIAIGGAEDKDGDCVILKEFIRLSRGARARIVVLTAATNIAKEVGAEYRKAFARLGMENLQIVDIESREDAFAESAIKSIEQATGVFFTGGDQLNITALMGGTPLQAAIRHRFEKGMTIAGTSAGATMMSNTMILNGGGDTNPRLGCVVIGPGMDFLPGVVTDTHFSERGRIGRLLTVVAHCPQNVGLGIDENTALVFHNDKFEVLGSGAVTVVDAGDLSYTNLPQLLENESLALFNVKIHILPSGHWFNLSNRRPEVPGKATRTHTHLEVAKSRARDHKDDIARNHKDET